MTNFNFNFFNISMGFIQLEYFFEHRVNLPPFNRSVFIIVQTQYECSLGYQVEV